MTKYKLRGVELTADFELTKEEADAYVEHYLRQEGSKLLGLDLKEVEDGYVDVAIRTIDKFQRLRRITGYLVESTDKWNNAKRAELSKRVLHGSSCIDGK